MTQSDLADKVGVHVNIIKRIEAGKGEGEKQTREALAEVLKCTMSDLYLDEDSPKGRAVRAMARQARSAGVPSLSEAAEVLSALADVERVGPAQRSAALYLLLEKEVYLDVVATTLGDDHPLVLALKGAI